MMGTQGQIRKNGGKISNKLNIGGTVAVSVQYD